MDELLACSQQLFIAMELVIKDVLSTDSFVAGIRNALSEKNQGSCSGNYSVVYLCCVYVKLWCQIE